MDQLKPFLAKADALLSKYPFLVQLEQKTGVPHAKVYAVISVWLLATASLVSGFCAQFTSSIVAIVYPLYKTLEAINKNDAKLSYWAFYFVILALVNLLDSISDILSSAIPFYYVFKTVFCMWLYYPRYFGVKVIYDVCKPYTALLFAAEKDDKKQ